MNLRPFFVLFVLLASAWVLGGEDALFAGGPLFVGSPTEGTDGQPILWDVTQPVPYRVDGGGLGTMANAQAVGRVQSLFQVWENVPTAAVRFTNAGPIQSVGAFTDGDIDTASEYVAVENDCVAGNQSPIVLDANGSVFQQLGIPSGVIGFAGQCVISNGRITAALAVLNGRWIDGNSANGELTAAEFDQAFVHEFGHYIGLDHSQINVDVLSSSQTVCPQDTLAGLPLMFPFLICQARTPTFPMLAPDDAAWVSRLYPETAASPPGQTPFTSAYGTISGVVFFSDGITHAGGVNVIARLVDNPSTTTQNESPRNAVSAVSGYLFTGLPGQSVTGTNPGSTLGSRNPALIGSFDIPVPPGTYTVEVESVDSAFVGGSSVGPIQFPIPSPGPKEFWDSGESSTDSPSTSTTITVAAGQTVPNINIILNGTPPRFDAFESAALLVPFAPGPYAALPLGPVALFTLRAAWLRRRRPCEQEAV